MQISVSNHGREPYIKCQHGEAMGKKWAQDRWKVLHRKKVWD